MTKWKCKRCETIVDMEKRRCKCETSPSPWEPVLPDTNSLTPSEYEYIYYALIEYSEISKTVKEPFYVSQVRAAKIKRLEPIIKKMKTRMEVDFPNRFVYC